MNAMVDTITDAVETTIAHSNAPSGPPRFMLQSAVRRALRDINERRTPLRRSNGVRTADSSRRSSPRTPSLQFAPGTGPMHGAAIRCTMDRRRWNHGWTPRHSSGLQQQRRGRGLASRIRIRP
ncbi:hypothetical protein PVAP13_3NG145601 [Panicum virgatum]|uniref:Uncharacterized protein n=1 Tax=Panicum virgatum TaxID=38727 RepID=A0A8T0U6T4_PANVG|nr:hypothetical protein PVAP13_3NG145601 [Panicum virgatum]